jgi:hypothetical protein
MAKCNRQRTIRAPLSSIIQDRAARAAFQRAEHDQGLEPLATVILAPYAALWGRHGGIAA